MEGAPAPKTVRQMERDLEADLSSARREFEQASRVLNHQITAIGEIPPQNETLSLADARKLTELAHANYREALKRFTEFAAYGTIPTPNGHPGKEEDTDSHSDATSA